MVNSPDANKRVELIEKSPQEPRAPALPAGGTSGRFGPWLQIRREQWEALSKYSLEAFLTRVVNGLRRDFPDKHAAASDGEARAQVLACIDLARAYGVEMEDDVDQFTRLRTELGDDFPTAFPWALKILTDSSLDGTAKVSRLSEAAVFERRPPAP